MSEPLWQPRTDRDARLVGAGFFVGGSALIAYQVSVISDAVAAQADVTYSLAAVGLGAMAVILGAYWLIHGLAGYAAVRALQTNPRQMRVLMIMSAIVLVIGVVALRLWLGGHGYDR